MAEGHREAARHASLTATSTTAPSTQKGDHPPSPFMRGFSPPLTLDASSVQKLLQARAHELAPGALQTARDWIDCVYANTTVETILAALEAREEPATKSARQEIAGKSPSSLKVTVRLLREARKSLVLKSCLQREYIAALACIRKHDFVEGVRAAVVDKDRAPRWSPSNLTEVTEAMVDLYFKASPQTVLF